MHDVFMRLLEWYYIKRGSNLSPATWEDTQGAYLLSKDAVPAEQQSVRVFDSWVLVFSQKEKI